jgi:hypothetical protein
MEEEDESQYPPHLRLPKRTRPTPPEFPSYIGHASDRLKEKWKALQQRLNERAVALEEMKLLQEKIKYCYIREGQIEAPKKCAILAHEYLRRLKCPGFQCDDDVVTSDTNPPSSSRDTKKESDKLEAKAK